MEKLVFRTISEVSEIEFFLDRFCNLVGVRLPTHYALDNRVVGVFLRDKLVGGYLIITTPPFRAALFVPDSIKASNPFFKIDTYDVMEVNGVWISPALKSAKQQFAVWKHILIDIFTCKKKFVLLMRDARNKNIHHIHQLTNPIQIYRGKPSLTSDQSTHDEINISYTTRWKLVLGLHSYWKEYRYRENRQRLKAKKMSYNRLAKANVEQAEPVK